MTAAATEKRRKNPKFNHVAMSMAEDQLDDAGRKEIIDFCSTVFGWEELPQMTEDRKRLVLMAYEYGQFVFLIANDNPMVAPRMDHFGMSVSTYDELQDFRDRAKAWADEHPSATFVDMYHEDYGPLKIHAFYIRDLLPMMVEVQFFEIVPGAPLREDMVLSS
jgi:hypothetical protein